MPISAPEEAEIVVTIAATTDLVLAANSEPALKPNQQNHSIQVATHTPKILWGFLLFEASLGPIKILNARDAAPDEICTGPPPAKSN